MPWRICLLGVIAATLAGSARADPRFWPTTAFGSGGIANVGAVDAIATAPDETIVLDGGRILLVAGGAIRGYEDSGALDTSFGNGGVASFPGFAATSVGAYSHWIFAGGSLGALPAVVRYFAGGAVDPAYGSLGIVS